MSDSRDVSDDEGAASPEPETGDGKFVFPNGAVYEGHYVMVGGVKTRHGCGTYTNGSEQYIGEWQHDAMHGRGEMVFCSGASYRGSFKNNKFHGLGRYEWNDGATYEGGWRDNKMHGRGCYLDSENSRWEGEFFNGMYDNGRAKVALR
ncbi:unnamed protein product [Hapterophycus canaliculatus]